MCLNVWLTKIFLMYAGQRYTGPHTSWTLKRTSSENKLSLKITLISWGMVLSGKWFSGDWYILGNGFLGIGFLGNGSFWAMVFWGMVFGRILHNQQKHHTLSKMERNRTALWFKKLNTYRCLQFPLHWNHFQGWTRGRFGSGKKPLHSHSPFANEKQPNLDGA